VKGYGWNERKEGGANFKTSHFGQSQCWAQILILKILNVFTPRALTSWRLRLIPPVAGSPALTGLKRFETGSGGVTIMEIVMVVAIIGILSGIAVPALDSFLPNYRLRAAVSDLYSNLQRAKQEAVRANGECAVYFDDANGKYQLVGGGLDGICDGPPAGNPPVPQDDDILLSDISLSSYGSGVQFGSGNAGKTVPGTGIPPAVTVSYGNDWIRFDSKGMAREMGYAYLTNINGASFAVGTPSLAGAIVQKKWLSRSWD